MSTCLLLQKVRIQFSREYVFPEGKNLSKSWPSYLIKAWLYDKLCNIEQAKKSNPNFLKRIFWKSNMLKSKSLKFVKFKIRSNFWALGYRTSL